MKKISNITILILSISFASAPVLARQEVNDYIGYMQSGQNADDRESRRIGKLLWNVEVPRDGQNSDDRESRRIGKLLWKNGHAQGGHGNVK